MSRARVVIAACLALLCALAWHRVADGYPERPPYGLPEELVPALDNPPTPERYELGRKLFFSTELSIDRSISCASCHVPERGFASNEAFSAGARGARTSRNVPSLWNRGFGRHFMWDGRVGSLEAQVLLPISNPDEMALDLEQALERLRADKAWKASFERAFDGPIEADTLAKALATFVRRQWLGDSPVDRFHGGDFSALTELERTGMWAFEGRGKCWKCHAGGNFSDEDFHNTGIAVRDGLAEEGRMAVTRNEEDRGKFKTPGLRGVAHSAPYMHDGSLATLEDVVAFYRRGGNPNPHLATELLPLEISDLEAEGLVHFLRALSRRAEGER